MSICALGLMTTPRHLNESPSNKEWKSQIETSDMPPLSQSLNESPSQKEGKYFCFHRHAHSVDASMKAPPKRKGNLRWLVRACSANLTLNESPSEKEGKFPGNRLPSLKSQGLNESPSEKEGKCSRMRRQNFIASPPQ